MDQDIHAMVAAEVYGIAQEQVTSSMRRSAKAINFGIIYGRVPMDWPSRWGFPTKRPLVFIDAYFAKYREYRNLSVPR